jgi:uncharacterized protein YabN with tetrapyrrole methylase and pyrophosphatase domain
MAAIDDLLKTMEALRAPGGCPWDREQTHQSICDSLVEEMAELLEAIDNRDFEHMREELGDVLLHVVFHAQMAAESGCFSFEDVAREINEKLVRRHPHVFGDKSLADTDAVLVQWEAIKAQEKRDRAQPEPFLKNLPPRLPALIFARDLYKQLQKKEALLEGGINPEMVKECAAGLTEERLGEELFLWSAAARAAGIDPESALRRYADRVRKKVEDAHEPPQILRAEERSGNRPHTL